MDLDEETLWVARMANLGHDFAKQCRDMCDENPSKHPDPLSHIINTTMTELWDWNFSQTEIRQAFLAAIEDMPRYAAGEERRS